MISTKPQKVCKSNGKASGPHVVVVRVPMSRITIHPRNPRRGNVEHIRRSLLEFGQFKPLVVQKSTGHILCGNHTYTAAQELGWTHIDVHYEDVDDPKAFRLALADNGTSDLAEWDQHELASMLADAGENIPGFDEDFLKQLERDLRAAGGAPDPGPQIGRAEDLAREWGTEEGQLWTIPSLTRPGHHHRIVCGDSTKKKVVDRVLAGARPKLMVTDPPYGVGYNPMWRDEATLSGQIGFGKWGKAARLKRVAYLANDTRANWTEAWRLFPDDVVYLWHGGLQCALVQSNIEKCGFAVRAQIIWSKPLFAISRGHYFWQHEPCLYGVRQGTDPAWKGLPEPGGDPQEPSEPAPPPEYANDHDVVSYAVRDGETAVWMGDRSQSTIWKIASAPPPRGATPRRSHWNAWSARSVITTATSTTLSWAPVRR